MRRLAAIIVVFFAVGSRPAAAADLYSFFDEQCQRYSGLMARVTETNILMVNLDGKLVRLPRERASSVVVHQLLENPLSVLHIDENLVGELREVWVGDDSAPSFVGWATSFYDDLFIFLDINGKTHVLDPGDVGKLVPVKVASGPHKPAVHAPAVLGFPPEIVPCSKTKPSNKALPPSQVIADRIKLGDYLAKLEENYRALDGFEERTRVYAQPFVFDDASRVGLIYWQGMDLPVPFYFRWASGRPYRFQSLTVIGNSSHEWLPFTEPSLSARSDVKSHFFNATFVGNFLALPAGEDPFFLDDFGDALGRTTPKVDVSYNYLIMMGADYWRFSASAGPAYLATKIIVPSPVDTGTGFADTVEAERLSPSARLRFQGAGLALRLIYFNTRISGTTFVPGISMDDEDDVAFKLRMDIVRAGATFTLIDEIELAIDQIVTVGRYEASAMMVQGGLDFIHSETAALISADFGRYVTVKGYARLFARRYGIDGFASDTRYERAFGGGLEFVF